MTLLKLIYPKLAGFIILFEVHLLLDHTISCQVIHKKVTDPKEDQPEHNGVKAKKNGKNKTKKIVIDVDDENPFISKFKPISF